MDDYTTVIISYIGEFESILERFGIDGEDLGQGFGIVIIGLGRIEELIRDEQVIYYELPRNLSEVALSGGEGERFTVRSGSCIEEAWERGLSGEGVILGVIDSGIDFTHSDFRNADGSTRILYIWDISRQDVGGVINKGVEYGSEEINAFLENGEAGLAFDESGHGTATAGAMGGNGNESGGTYSGAAPKGEFIVVKVSSNRPIVTVDIMRGIHYIVNKAVEMRKPAVINISYGTSNGSHGGRSLFELYIDRISHVGQLVIAVAAGNEGMAGHHYLGRIAQGQVYDVKFNVINELGYIYLSLWKNFADKMNFELILPDGSSTGVLPYNGRNFRMNLGNTRIGVDIGRPTPYTYAQEVFFFAGEFYNVLPYGVWTLRIYGVDIIDGIFSIWLPINELISESTAFENPISETTITLPATALYVLSVGAYNGLTGEVAEFSGLGYSGGYIIKPDLIAPGVNIIAPLAGGGYEAFTGTSIASPIAAGAAALFMEWGILKGNDPFIYGQRLKGYLKVGAFRKEGVEYPNIQEGYGRLCIDEAIKQAEEFNEY